MAGPNLELFPRKHSSPFPVVLRRHPHISPSLSFLVSVLYQLAESLFPFRLLCWQAARILIFQERCWRSFFDTHPGRAKHNRTPFGSIAVVSPILSFPLQGDIYCHNSADRIIIMPRLLQNVPRACQCLSLIMNSPQRKHPPGKINDPLERETARMMAVAIESERL